MSIKINEIIKKLEAIGEYYAVGYLEKIENSPFIRYSSAIRKYLENVKLPDYNGEPLYPCGAIGKELCVRYNFSHTVEVVWKKLEEKDDEAADFLKNYLTVSNDIKGKIPEEHRVGGAMYTHSHPNFERIANEGLNSYIERINRIKNNDIRLGLLDVIEGIKNFHARCLEKINKYGETTLYNSLKKVPFEPAESLYDAMVCRNFIFYIDGCDNIGNLDLELIKFYKREDITDVLKCFFKNVDMNDGWSGAIGPYYNPITLQCLKAIKGMRRPSLELRVTDDMPDEVWDAAIDAIYAGGGSPSLYNEKGYQSSLKKHFPDIPNEDLIKFAGGGCTETMLTGLTNAGSLDAGINLAYIFEKFMKNLYKFNYYEDFYDEFVSYCSKEIEHVLDCVSTAQKVRSEVLPQPVRTLLMDDCIDKGKDYNDGGTRYAWSIINIAGMVNVIDSLLTVKKIVFIDKVETAESFVEKISRGITFINYHGLAHHGKDEEEANQIAKKLSCDICSIFENKTPYSGGKFLPSSIQFITYVDAGKYVGATPDGRTSGSPLCDSIGAIHNNDTNGPTALLNSASSLCQEKLIGTPVLNLYLSKTQMDKGLKGLVKGYFEKGGMQIQITCVNEIDLKKAQNNPDEYPNLVVRVGGYSEYFNRLSPEMQNEVINKTYF